MTKAQKVKALVEEAQNAVWNGPSTADEVLDDVTLRILRLFEPQFINPSEIPGLNDE